MVVNIVNHQRRLALPVRLLRAAARLTLGRRRWQVALVFVTPAASRRLNRSYLGHDYAADVLSFDQTDGAKPAVELVICPAVAAANARAYGDSSDVELCRYVIHGLLHIMGYDDRRAVDCRRMWRRQEQLLRRVVASRKRTRKGAAR